LKTSKNERDFHCFFPQMFSGTFADIFTASCFRILQQKNVE